MAIKDTLRGGMDGEHAHGSARTSYSMKNGRTPIDNSRADEARANEIMGYETGSVPPLMTMDGIKQTAINAANNGYVQASATGAVIGAAALGGLNLENPDAPIVNGPMSAAGAVAGAAIGAAGKFAKDTFKKKK
jgi:hypothetical protein